MTRKDIRKGTYIILIIAFLCTVAVFSTAYMRQDNEDQKGAANVAKTAFHWEDSLTNERSEYAPLHRMDMEIERFLSKWSIKGMSVAVTRNDSLLYAKGYGMADVEEDIKMSPRHIMRLASASKLVTAVAIMRLVDAGKLRLDDKVFGPNGILNDDCYTDAIKDKRLFELTVDHLLMHKGGFGMGAGDPMFNTKDIISAKHLDGAPTNEELTQIVLGRKIAFSPGKGFRYSNFGYMLLSLIIERISGRSYWDYVTEDVLYPAGCFKFKPATNYYAERNDNEVRYYGPDTVAVEEYNGSGRMVERVYGGSNIHGLAGAGGWCASAPDLARLVASIDKYPRVGNILTAASIDSLTAFGRDDDKRSRGWSEIDAYGKWRRTGTLSSTHALIERFPNGECWVLITNSGVWTGHNFSRSMTQLVSDLRAKYGANFPRRDMFSE